MRLTDSILVQARPEKIWPFLTEPAKILAWYLPLEEFAFTGEQTSGQGASFYYIEKSPVGSVRLNYVVTEWVENETVAFRLTSGQFLKSDTQRWAIASEDGASRFTFSEEAEMPYGLLGRLLGLVASVSSSANVHKMLAKLKELAEVA